MARDYTEVLFAQAAPASAWRERLQLDTLEQEQGLPRGVLTAVLHTESRGNPSAESRKGAQGLFQFMPATARAYNLNPYDPQAAARAASRELGTLYKKYEGDLPTTLAAWNWGQGNVDRQGLDKAPRETRGFLSSVLSTLGPRSAEAAERPKGGGMAKAQGRDYTQELFGTPAPPAPMPSVPVVPAPPGGQGPVLPPAPATAPLEQPLGPVEQPEASVMSRLRPNVPAAEAAPTASSFAPSGVPPGLEAEWLGAVLSKYKPVEAATSERPLGLPTRGEPGGGPRILGGSRQMPDLSALEAALKRPAEMVPSMATTGAAGYLGAALGAATGPFAPVASPVFAGLASYGAHRLNQLAGLTPGEPEILPRTLDDYLQLGLPMTPLAVPVAKAAGRYVGEPVIRGLRRLVPGARRAINAAEEQTAQNAADYLQTYTQEVATGTQKDVQARAGYALSEAIEAQREAARRAAHAQRVRRAEEKAATGTAKDVEDYKQALADYETATKQHLAAAERARALPEEYRPSPPPSETPGAAPAPLRPGARASSVYYQRFEDQAKGMPADLTPARTMAETFQTEFGEHLPRMLPPRMQRVITDVLNPETEGSVSQVHAFMKSIGRLTRSKDSETRGAARQLYGALAESLEISAPTHLQALLRQAKTVWKQEEGVYELQRKLRMGKSRGLLSRDPATGNIQLNVRGIVQLMDDEDVLQWFTPEVQKQFQTDIRRFVGTPALPKETPILPPPRVPTDVPPLQPRIVPPNLAKGPPPPYTPPPFEPPPPVEPKMTRRGLREALAEIGGLAALSHFGGTPGKYITGAIAAGDFANQALSRILLSPKLRRLLLRSMEPNGTIDPQMFGMLAAAADVLPLGTENVSEEAARTETTDVGIPYTTERPR